MICEVVFDLGILLKALANCHNVIFYLLIRVLADMIDEDIDIGEVANRRRRDIYDQKGKY